MNTTAFPSPTADVPRVFSLYAWRWLRSRAPLGFLAFVGALCAFDGLYVRTTGVGPWWETVVFIMAWTGFLAGYDTFERLRAEGGLRLLLTTPAPRWVFAVGMAIGGVAVCSTALLVTFGYLIVTSRGPAGIDILLAIPVLLLGATGFVVYGQLLSTILPRDSSAILGVIGLLFGATPADRWIPDSAPEILRQGIHLLWNGMPTSYRIGETLSNRQVVMNIGLMFAYCAAGITLTAILLGRQRLVARGGYL